MPRWALLGELLVAAGSLASCLGGCNVQTAESPYPVAADPAFTVTAITLPLPLDQPQPVNPVITITLSDLPDPDTVQFPTIQLGLRGQSVQYIVSSISLAARQLTIKPRSELLPESDYFVQIGQSLRALSGQSLAQPGSGRFHTGSFLQPTPPVPDPVSLSGLLSDPAGLKARCGLVGCHSSRDAGGGTTATAAQGLDFSLPSSALAPYLTTTVGAGSLEGLLLVRPGAPERSYLIRKLVAATGFARISGAPMPPPEGTPPLDAAILQSLEVWIRQGAQP